MTGCRDLKKIILTLSEKRIVNDQGITFSNILIRSPCGYYFYYQQLLLSTVNYLLSTLLFCTRLVQDIFIIIWYNFDISLC